MRAYIHRHFWRAFVFMMFLPLLIWPLLIYGIMHYAAAGDEGGITAVVFIAYLGIVFTVLMFCKYAWYWRLMLVALTIIWLTITPAFSEIAIIIVYPGFVNHI